MNVRKLPAITGAVLIAVAATAHADIASDLQAQVQSLQRQLDAVKAQLDAITAEMQKQKQEQQQPRPGATAPFIERKPGDALTFLVPGGGELTLYGNRIASPAENCRASRPGSTTSSDGCGK